VIRGAAGHKAKVVSFNALTRNVLLIIAYALVAFFSYHSAWFNSPAWPGWDGNHTSASWDTPGWDWDFVDCVYFAMVTMTTVGYGDMPTLTQSMRIWTMVFGFVGVTVVAGSITVIADYITEQGRKNFIQHQRVLLRDAEEVGKTVKDIMKNGASSATARKLTTAPRGRTALKAVLALRWIALFFVLCILLGEIENATFGCGFLVGSWTCGSPHECELWKNGALPSDGPDADRGSCWSWVDELYYGVITMLTIGYGDVSAHTKGGKLLSAFLVIFGLLAFTILLAELNELQQAKRLGAEKTLPERIFELREVIEQDNDGTVTADEYIIFTLKKMGKVDDDTLGLLREQFTALDADHSGCLDVADIDMLEKACKLLNGSGAPTEAELRELGIEISPPTSPSKLAPPASPYLSPNLSPAKEAKLARKRKDGSSPPTSQQPSPSKSPSAAGYAKAGFPSAAPSAARASSPTRSAARAPAVARSAHGSARGTISPTLSPRSCTENDESTDADDERTHGDVHAAPIVRSPAATSRARAASAMLGGVLKPRQAEWEANIELEMARRRREIASLGEGVQARETVADLVYELHVLRKWLAGDETAVIAQPEKPVVQSL